MRVAQRALLSKGRLIAQLETAAIGHATKNAWNELRVIDQTEPEEELILFVEIEVHTRIKGIAMFEKVGRIGKVSKKRAIRWSRIKVQEFDGIGIQPAGGNEI